MVAHALAHHRRLLVVRYGKVPIRCVLGRRRNRHVEAFRILQPAFLLFHVPQRRDEHGEHNRAHRTANGEAEAARQHALDDAAGRMVVAAVMVVER